MPTEEETEYSSEIQGKAVKLIQEEWGITGFMSMRLGKLATDIKLDRWTGSSEIPLKSLESRFGSDLKERLQAVADRI